MSVSGNFNAIWLWRAENNIIDVSSSYEEKFKKAEEELCEKLRSTTIIQMH